MRSKSSGYHPAQTKWIRFMCAVIQCIGIGSVEQVCVYISNNLTMESYFFFCFLSQKPWVVIAWAKYSLSFISYYFICLSPFCVVITFTLYPFINRCVRCASPSSLASTIVVVGSCHNGHLFIVIIVRTELSVLLLFFFCVTSPGVPSIHTFYLMGWN